MKNSLVLVVFKLMSQTAVGADEGLLSNSPGYHARRKAASDSL